MNLDNKTIVLVDDNNVTNYYNTDIVMSSGKFEKVIIHESPTQTLDFLKESLAKRMDIPSIFVIDVKMPEMDGFELIDEIDELFDQEEVELSPIFVVLTTSNHMRDYEQFDKTPLAKKFIPKPLDEEKFNEVLKEFEFV